MVIDLTDCIGLKLLGHVIGINISVDGSEGSLLHSHYSYIVRLFLRELIE